MVVDDHCGVLLGTENSLHTLLDDLQTDLTFMTSALQPMRLAPALRDAAGQVLAPPDKVKVSRESERQDGWLPGFRMLMRSRSVRRICCMSCYWSMTR